MSIERKLIAACLASRDAYETIKDRLDDRLNGPNTQLFLDLCAQYYANDGNAQSVDRDWIVARLPAMFDNPKKVDATVELLSEIESTTVSVPNVVELVLEARRHDLGHKLAIALSNGDKSAPALIEEYQELLNVREADDEDEVLHNYSAKQSIAEVLDSRNLIRLPTKALTEACDGGVTEGTHIVVFGRPEIGKTALSVSFARVFAHQGLDGIYFGNEDPIKRIAVRAQSAFSGLTKQQIVADPAELDRRLDVAKWDKVRFIPLHPGTPREIRKYVKMYKPKWIVVDQIRNLHVRADTRVNQLEAAATEVRNIANGEGLVGVSVTQAGDSAEGKLTLGMGDVDFSNTGIPATADLMIGFGANEAYLKEGRRMISLPKNKISGNHTNFQVRINEQLSRVEDV